MSVRRIEPLEGGHAVPLVPEAPLLSSSHIAWEGILLEEHSTGARQTKLRQRSAIYLALHTGAALQQDWHSAGKFFSILTFPGSINLLTPRARSGPFRIGISLIASSFRLSPAISNGLWRIHRGVKGSNSSMVLPCKTRRLSA